MAVFKGSGVAIITPFKAADQSVDYEGFADLIDYQIDHGTDAIIVCGTTGEAATMTEAEHVDVCRFCYKHVRGRVPVIAGSGSNCTATAVQLSRDIAGGGADALLVVTPYYNKGTQKGLVEHYRTIAAAVDVPIIMYNVPSRTGVNLLPETVARIVREIPNVVGVKEASGNISQCVKLMTLTDGNIDLYSGNDDEVVPLMAIGGLGVISVVANVAPQAMHDLCQRFFDGDVAGAMELQRRTHALFSCLFSEVNPIPVKKAAALMGLPAGPLRMPLSEMEPENAAKLKKAMEEFGLL